jgi:hypothetical protein
MCRDLNQRAMEQAVKALTLVLQAGNFGLVAFDVAEAPADAWRRLPFTTWLRLQRMVEGRPTICVLVGNEPMARSAAGLTVKLEGLRAQANLEGLRAEGSGSALRAEGSGVEVRARIVRARTHGREDRSVSFGTTPVVHD